MHLPSAARARRTPQTTMKRGGRVSLVLSRTVGLIQSTGRVLSIIQVLAWLPVALEHDRDTFLAFSASLAAFYFLLSTLRQLAGRTQASKLVYALSMTQNFLIPLSVWFCAHLYSPLPLWNERLLALREAVRHASLPWLGGGALPAWLTPETLAITHWFTPRTWTDSAITSQVVSVVVSAAVFVLSRVPAWWYTFLIYSSPVFSLLEGFSTLLVVQSFAPLSRWLINEPAASRKRSASNTRAGAIMHRLLSFGMEPYEAWQMLFLLFSATVYVTAAVALYMCFDGATEGRSGSAAAIGASISSTLWISVIAFAVRKANVVETSLMFAYVVFNIYQLSSSLGIGTDPLALVESLRASHAQPGVPLIFAQQTTAVLDYLIDAVEHCIYLLQAANAALPTTVIVSLVYRMTVLYSAIRVLPHLNVSYSYDPRRDALWRRRNQAWGERRASCAATPESSGPVTPTEPAGEHSSLSDSPGSVAQKSAEVFRTLSDLKEPDSPSVADAPESRAGQRPRSATDAGVSSGNMSHPADAPHRSKPTERGSCTWTPLSALLTGAVIAGLAIYSRFVLIAVYSHLLRTCCGFATAH